MICWSPLAAGMLSGKYRGQDKPAEGTRHGHQANIVVGRYWFDEATKMVDAVVANAEEMGKTPSQIALGWLFGDTRITAAIVGARRVEQIAENLDAGEFDLPYEVRQELTDAMPLAMGYPYEWTVTSGPGLKRAEMDPAHVTKMP
jgi:aryl-alcohol dehydrogenase-like predicted oxidoreductase